MIMLETPMPSLSPWSLLTADERRLLVPKLVTPAAADEINDADLTGAGEVFDRALLSESERGEPDGTVVAERLLTMRNFVEQTGGYDSGPLWQQVARLTGVRRSYLELFVHRRDEFLVTLGEAGFVINREPFWTIHKFDSARALTRFSHEPSLHFANDRANGSGYGATYFFTHWDVSSVWFEESSWRFGRVPGLRSVERLRAARRHHTGFASPEAVQSYLAQRKLVDVR